MVLVYNKEKVTRVYDLFQKNQIVTLKITKSEAMNQYIIEYTTVDDYDLADRATFVNQFSKKNILEKRALIVTLLQEFIEMMDLGKVSNFDLEFDLTGGHVSFIKSYEATGTPLPTVASSSLESLIAPELLLQEVPDLFEKLIAEAGKKSKYIPVTYGGLISKLKDVL